MSSWEKWATVGPFEKGRFALHATTLLTYHATPTRTTVRRVSIMLKRISRYALGGLFILAGGNHFVNRALYLRIMPPYIPWPQFMVELSGACEIGLGAALLWPRFRRWAAWGLIALLGAVFPANLHMALHPEAFPEFKPALLWARLPFQAVFLAWSFWHTQPDDAVNGRILNRR